MADDEKDKQNGGGGPGVQGTLKSKGPDQRYFRVLCEMLGNHRGKVLGTQESLCRDGKHRTHKVFDTIEGGFPGSRRHPITGRWESETVITLEDLMRQADVDDPKKVPLDRLFKAKAIEEVMWVERGNHPGRWAKVSQDFDIWVPERAMQSNRVIYGEA